MEGKTEKSKELTVRQQQLLVELVKNTDLQKAAIKAGVGRTTVYRWLENPRFAAELARMRNEAMKEALDSVKALTTRAAQELVGLLDTEDERLKRLLCNDILGHAIKVRELEEIERRLARMEERMNQEMKGTLR
jgi:phage terminase small subunit